MGKVEYRFPLKNLNNLTLIFPKEPTKEDWKAISLWFEYWGDNLCEKLPQKIPTEEIQTNGI